MGGKRGKRNHFAQKKRDRKEGKTRDTRESGPYEEIKRENEDFFKYYKHQKICKTDEEWESFLSTIKRNLPTTFRVTGSRKEAQLLLNVIKSEFLEEYVKAVRELHAIDEDVKVELPYSLPWYPGELAWQLELGRRDIRRSEPLFKLHNFLIAETNSGNISRQEAVSMIPPLVLDVQSHHKILDMCAAPGSKTAQIIELLHGDEEKLPTGFVVANDIDNKRCYMLVHQAKRLNSPCCMITNTDSAAFPELQYSSEDGKLHDLRFDRILCDVPCSGDGTMRKNPDIWSKWNVNQGNGLHGIQYRIVRRGLELLAEGGRLVYSTCSLNPVENEAVLCRVLEDCEGSVELVDVSDKLKDLKHDPGMEYWEPCSKDLEFCSSMEDVSEKNLTIVRPSLFPPSDVKKFHLERCIRVLPQHQNTGGFFVAVLQKKSSLPWKPEAPVAGENSEEVTEKPAEPPKKKKKFFHRGFKEDPFVFFEKNEPVFQEIKDFYQVSDEFNPECLLTRCKEGKKKHVYFCTEGVRNVVRNNEETVKIINTGVKTFSRVGSKNTDCKFRLAQEGLATLRSFLGNSRRLVVSKEDLIHLLKNIDPLNAPQIESVSSEMRDQLNKMDQGSCILHYSDETMTLTLAGWKGVRSVRAYTEVNDAIHNLRLLGADVSQYEKNKFKKGEPLADVDEEAKENANEVPASDYF